MFLLAFFAVHINNELIGLDTPWNYLFWLVVIFLPLISYNAFIPTKCPSKECNKFTLYSEDLLTNMAPFYFRCKSCSKRYYNKHMQSEEINNT